MSHNLLHLDYPSFDAVFKIYSTLFRIIDSNSGRAGDAKNVTRRVLESLDSKLKTLSVDVMPKIINGRQIDYIMLSRVLNTPKTNIEIAHTVATVLAAAYDRVGLSGRDIITQTIDRVIEDHSLGAPRFHPRVKAMVQLLIDSPISYPWYQLTVPMTPEDIRDLYLCEYRIGGRELLIRLGDGDTNKKRQLVLTAVLNQIDTAQPQPQNPMVIDEEEKRPTRKRAAASPSSPERPVVIDPRDRPYFKARRLPSFISPQAQALVRQPPEPARPPTPPTPQNDSRHSSRRSSSYSGSSSEKLLRQLQQTTVGSQKRRRLTQNPFLIDNAKI